MLDPPFGIGSRIVPGTSKVIEEAGEVIQVLAKIQAIGYVGQYWDGTNLHDELENELGDLLATVEYLVAKNKLDRKKIKKRKQLKLEKFARWHKNVRAGRKPTDDGPPKGKKK